MTMAQNVLAYTTQRSIIDAMSTGFLFLEILQSEATPVERSRVPSSVWEDASAPTLAVNIGPISHDNLKVANTRNETRLKMNNEIEMDPFQSEIFIFKQFIEKGILRSQQEYAPSVGYC